MLATVTQHSTATPGSYIEVDDVSFVGTNSGSFPNGNFETWTDHNLEEPDNWTSSNSFTTYGGGLVSVDKSTQANSGTYSAHITTQSSAFAGNIAFLLTARLGQNNHMTHEIVYSPIAKLTGYYKYAPVLNDSGEVIINFTKYNGSTMMNDAVDSFHYKFTSAANFTYFELLTPNITGAPDSMWVAILSSNLDGDTTTVHVGSQLWIDDLAFVYPSGISIPYNEYMSHFTISPNPGSDNISLSFTMKNEGDVKIHLYNNAGVEIKNYPLGNLAVGNQSFSPEISELADGIYFFGVETNGKTEMHKFILSR